MSPRPEPLFPAPLQFAFEDYDPADERRRESLFALGNGKLLVRACPCEAGAEDGSHYPGTYHAGCYSRRTLRIEGKRLGHDSLVNLPNWLPLTFRIEGDEEWFSLRSCDILAYRHTLDMARGLAERRAVVRDAHGRRTAIREQRLVSMVRPVLAALRLELTPENWSGLIELRSALDGGITNHNTDRRVLPGYRHLEVSTRDLSPGGPLLLAARTRQSRMGIALAARTRADGVSSRRIDRGADVIAEHLSCPATAGMALAVEKIASITTARDPATSEPREAACAAVDEAPAFAVLRDEHARAWVRLWERVAIEAEHPVLARGIAFHAFHLLQTISPHSVQVDVGLPSRGWQEAYHGQVFWDEIFAFPFLNHRFPEIARGLLLYRYRRLPEARRAARAAGHAGAMFPWRSATTGAEQTPDFQINPLSGHWMPDHTRLQRHIGAAIAHNAWHYYLATADASFLAEYGAELLTEIARFWASLARHDPKDDRFDICGVIGPDEYHNAYPGADEPGLHNNAYTNVMAAATLLRADEALDQLPPHRRDELACALGLTDAERAQWRRVARRLRLCFHDDGVISQFQGFDFLKPFDGRGFAERHPDGRVDWELEARGDTVDAYQASKQADVLMLLYLFQPDELATLIRTMGYEMDQDRLRRTAAYYLDRTHP